MRRRVATVSRILPWLGLFLLGPSFVMAADVAIRQLNITVKSHPYVYLEIGTAGAIVDQISFRVAALPGTGPVRGESTGKYPVPLIGDGLLTAPGTATITINAAIPLQDGRGNQIPFSEVYWTGGGDIPSGQFAGSAQQIIFQQSAHRGRLKINGAMAFFYRNQNYFPAGTYTGRVIYTLTAP